MSRPKFSYFSTAGGVSVTLLVGMGAYFSFMTKIGWIVHDQGPVVECEMVDTHSEAAHFAFNICDFTHERFGNFCSYNGEMIIGPWVFDPDSTDRGVAYHASGWNRRTNGTMLVRTDDLEFNKQTYHTFRDVWLPDKLSRLDTVPLVMLGHFHVAKNGKEDPRPYKEWMTRDSLFWDLREDPEFDLPGPPQWIRDNYNMPCKKN